MATKKQKITAAYLALAALTRSYYDASRAYCAAASGSETLAARAAMDAAKAAMDTGRVACAALESGTRRTGGAWDIDRSRDRRDPLSA